jgi:hypothetical protein
MSDGSLIEPHISLTGIWDFDKDKTASVGGLLVGTDDFRMRVEAGVLVRTPTGLGLRATVAYDGIGDDNFHALSGQLWVNVPLPN